MLHNGRNRVNFHCSFIRSFNLKKVIVLALLVLGGSFSGWAQGDEREDLCDKINRDVVLVQNPAKNNVTRYLASCILTFSFKEGSEFNIRTEKYEDKDDAWFEFESLRARWVSNRKDEVGRSSESDSGGPWDECWISEKSSGKYVVLLRDKKNFIMILGPDLAVLQRTEQLFRNVYFPKDD